MFLRDQQQDNQSSNTETFKNTFTPKSSSNYKYSIVGKSPTTQDDIRTQAASPTTSPPNMSSPSTAAHASSIELPTVTRIDGGSGGNDDRSSMVLDSNEVTTTTTTTKLSKPLVQSGFWGASSNLMNSIVGAGIIGIPYSLRESGLIAGLFLLVLVAYLTDKSLRIIVGLASFHPKLKNRDVRTFEDLAAYPFGIKGYNFISINMFIMAYGAMLAYLLIIKDTIPSILGVHDRLSRTLIMIATSMTIMLPLSMQRDMASLSITSLFSVLADIVLVGFITAFSPVRDTVQQAGGFEKVLEKDGINPTIFIGLGILSTAMACQHSAFIVSESLRNKTMAKWARVTGFSISASAALCAILGVSGYLGFLDETKGDVLNNFDHDSSIANVARFLLAITMFFTYPMESFVARHVLVQLIHGGDLDGRDDPSHSGQDGEEAGGILCMNRRQTWSFAIYLLTLFPALFVDDLGPVLSITGSLGGGCIAYFGPGLVYLGVNGDAFLSFAYGLLGRSVSYDESRLTAADLPIEGDATNMILPNPDSLAMLDDMCKPIWWYILGFPLWTKIANVGMSNMRAKVNDADGVALTSSNMSTFDENVMMPSNRDFFISIFFMCFGVVSAIAGVASNIYVQWSRNQDA